MTSNVGSSKNNYAYCANSGRDGLQPMRDEMALIAARERLHPVGQSAGNSKPLAARHAQQIQPPSSASRKESDDGDLSPLVLGVVAGVSALGIACNWFMGSSAERPAVAPDASLPDAVAPDATPPVVVHCTPPAYDPFHPLDADPNDLEAIRLAERAIEQARRDAELAQQLADADARAADLAEQQRQAQISKDGIMAQELQDLPNGRQLN